jgi:predicted patatin/cPLA2 family phospholipase
MAIAGGVAAALFQRERTGQGIEVDVSLLGTAIWVLSPDITATYLYGRMLPQAGEMPAAPNPLVGTYFCQDGKGLVLMMLQASASGRSSPRRSARADIMKRYPTAERASPRRTISRRARRALRDTAAGRVGSDAARVRVHLGAPTRHRPSWRTIPQVQANGFLLQAETGDGRRHALREPRAVRGGAARRPLARLRRRRAHRGGAARARLLVGRHRALERGRSDRLMPKRVFILGGGAALGAHQVGAMKYLAEQGITPDAFVASSIGVLNACCYGSGGIPRLEEAWREFRSIPRIVSPSFWHNPILGLSFFSMDRLTAALEEFIDFPELFASPLEMEFVVLNLSRGRGEMHSKHSCADWRELRTLTRCGYAIPGLFPPIQFRSDWYVDGGFAWNIPLERAIQMGATEIYLLAPIASQLPYKAGFSNFLDFLQR